MNYAGITRNILHDQVKDALTQSNRSLQLPLTEETYETWIKSLPENEGQQINSKLSYLSSWFGKESIKDLVKDDIAFYRIAQEEDTPGTESVSFRQTDGTTHAVPRGYRQMTFVRQHSTLTLAPILPIALDAGTDTLCLPLDSLQHWQDTQLPVALPTTDGNTFVTTYLQLFIDKDQGEVETEIEGYLFHNNP